MNKSRQALGNGSLWRASQDAQTYPQLNDHHLVDVIIVGGGYTGCSAALHAAKNGASVALLEARSIGAGGSGRNVGLVNAGLWLAPDKVEDLLGESDGRKLNLALKDAPDLVFSLTESLGINCDATRSGTLQCAHSNEGFKYLEDRHAQVNARGGSVSLLGEAEAQARVGTRRIKGALFDPNAGTIHPLNYCIGLATAANRLGAQIYEHSPAIHIEAFENGWRVKTKHGSIEARGLLIATNGYALHGAQSSKSLFTPVHYFQVATKPISDNLRADILRAGEGCWDTAQVMSSYRFDATGRLIVGSVGALGQGRIRLDWARRKIAHLFPSLQSVPLEFAWHGAIAMTSDHLPKVAQLGPNGFSVFGYSGRGIGPGTVFGKAAAAALLDQDVNAFPVLPQPINAERFSAIKAALYQLGANAFLSLNART